MPSIPVGAPAPQRKKPLWKRWWFLVAVGVVVIGIIGAIAAPKDDDESSTATTERRAEQTTTPEDGDEAADTTAPGADVSDGDSTSETTVSAEADTTDPPSSEVVPLPPNANPALAVVGVDSLPDGEPGKLSVIAQAGTLERSGSLPIVVRNMTDEPVAHISVTGTARDASGALVASGSDQGLNPQVVGPGEIAFGYVYFSYDGVPDGTTFELSVSGSDPDDVFLGGVDLVVVEHNRSGSSIIVGLRNDTSEEVSGPIGLSLICFDEAGVPTGTNSGFTDQDTAAPGATVTGSIDFYSDQVCERYILAGSGYNF